MPKFNTVTLIGHLVRDAEMRYTQNGKGVTNFTLAVNRDFGDECDFFECTAWNRGNYKLAEYTGEYKKGNAVFVFGNLIQDRWENKDGQKRSKVKINIDKAFNFSRKPQKDEPTDKDLDNEEINEDDFDVPF